MCARMKSADDAMPPCHSGEAVDLHKPPDALLSSPGLRLCLCLCT